MTGKAPVMYQINNILDMSSKGYTIGPKTWELYKRLLEELKERDG